MQPALLTPKEVAAHFHTTSKTVLEWCHVGPIPAEVAEGRLYRFDLEKVKIALATRSSTNRST